MHKEPSFQIQPSKPNRERLIEERMEKLSLALEDPIIRAQEMKKLDEIFNPSEHIPTERINGQLVEKNDAVVKLLKSCVKNRAVTLGYDDKLNKLVDRINLDRPILQKEKIKLILFE